MKYLLLSLLICSNIGASQPEVYNSDLPETALTEQAITSDESDEIYWNTPKYLEKPGIGKKQYVYHLRRADFFGDQIIPLNRMPEIDGYLEIYNEARSKYKGREKLLTRVIPTLGCLWNDVVFLSPVHPHIHYEEYKKIGFTIKKRQYYKIPIEVLKDKPLTVWKWFSYKKYPKEDPIHESSYSYCDFDFLHFQEMDELPEDTKEFYRTSFDPEHPDQWPKFHWYRIPHILCQDFIDLSDERITLIDWEDPIEE